jgi:hypothetical protein
MAHARTQLLVDGINPAARAASIDLDRANRYVASQAKVCLQLEPDLS